MKRIPTDGIQGEAALREAAATECGQVMGLVRAALAAKLGLTAENAWQLNVEAMFPDRVIACRDGRYYAYSYTLSDDNQVSLGEAQEVVEQFVAVRMTEASAGIVFLEAKDAEGAVWDVAIIRAGLSLNGTFYPDAVLRDAVPLFEGRNVFARADAAHVRGEGKDVNKIAGWISGARFIEARAAQPAFLGGIMNLTAPALRQTIVEAWRRGKKDLVGLSIDAEGKAKTELREGKRIRVAQSITKVNSVDLVVEPSAGGALVRLVEAAANPEEQDPMKERMLAAIKAKAPAIFAKIDPATITDAELEARYAEALATPAPAAPTGVTAATVAVATGLTAEQVGAQVAEQVRLVEARAYLRMQVAASQLAQPVQDRILADVGARARFVEADVDAAIRAERIYVARLTESGRVQMGADGQPTLIDVEDRSLKIAGMLDAFFDPAHKEHRGAQSFRECYIEITGDQRVTGLLANCERSRMAESLGRFAESLDSTSFASVLGDAITRRLIADYRAPNLYSGWRQCMSVVPVNDFRTQHRTRFGGYGNLPTVAQGDPYTSLTSPTDEEATYAITKRGGTEDLTIEMVANDDVGAIRRIPTNLSRAALRTLGTFAWDFVRTNPTLYDSVAFFHATHANLGSAALDATALAAARLRMLKQTEAGSAARLGIGPRYLAVPPDLEYTALDLFRIITTVSEKTALQGLALAVLSVWYWTDVTDWAVAADPLDIPSIEVGFLNGNEEPELFVQDQPNVGAMFSNDKLTYKIRHIYGGQVVNYRGWDKSVVAG